MRALIIQFWPRFETALEIAQKHLDAGDEVVFLGCDAQMTGCWLSLEHAASACSKCQGQRKLGLSILEPHVKYESFLTLTEPNVGELKRIKTSFASLEELKQFKFETFDLGMAVASGLISAERNPNLDVHRYARQIARSIVSCLAVYRSVQNHLDRQKADVVYMANGRGCETRAVLRACQSRRVKCLAHDVGCDQYHYDLFENTYPHDRPYFEKRIRVAWEAASRSDRETIASKWYEERALAVERSPSRKALPEGFDPTKRNIAIFNSSEDEFAALDDDWNNPIYKDQLEGLKAIQHAFGRDVSRFCLYLRIHPNLKGVHNEVTRALSELKAPGFQVILAGEAVNSYELMRACRTVLTFGSTMGIEAVYAGKPSVLAGISMYRGLGGVYLPHTHDEVVQLLKSDLQPKEKEPASMYGFYMATAGVRFQYYRPETPMQTHFVSTGAFKSRSLTVDPLTHYFWALVHRLPWLNQYLDARNLSQTEKRLEEISTGKEQSSSTLRASAQK